MSASVRHPSPVSRHRFAPIGANVTHPFGNDGGGPGSGFTMSGRRPSQASAHRGTCAGRARLKTIADLDYRCNDDGREMMGDVLTADGRIIAQANDGAIAVTFHGHVAP